MKKLLSILGVLSIVPSAGLSLVSCTNNSDNTAPTSSLIQNVLKEIEDVSYSSENNAKSDIVKRIKAVEGVDGVQFQWTGSKAIDATKTFTVSISYKAGYSGETTFSSSIKITVDTKGNINTQIQSTVSVIESTYFESKESAESEIKTSISAIEGVDTLNIEWSEENVFTLTISYKTDYTGDESFNGKIKLSININDKIDSAITEIKGTRYESVEGAKIGILNKIHDINGVQSIANSESFTIDNNSFTIEINYKDGFTGHQKFSGSITAIDSIVDQTFLINDMISKLILNYYDSNNDFANALANEIVNIPGTSLDGEIKWTNENEFSFNVIYQEGYSGRENFKGTFEHVRTNLDSQIQITKNDFLNNAYNQHNYINAEDDLKVSLKKIIGIENIATSFDEAKTLITTKLTFANEYTGTVTWYFGLTKQQAAIYAPPTKTLSYKTSVSPRGSFTLTGQNLSSLDLVATSSDDNMQVSINNGNLVTYWTKSNIAGTKDYTIEIYDKTYTDIKTSFIVHVEGQPKFGGTVNDQPSLIKLRIKNSYKVDFRMNYMDPSQIQSLTATHSDSNKQITTSISYSGSSNIYTLTITGVSGNDIGNGGSQDVVLKYDGKEIWKNKTQVWEYPENYTSTHEGLGYYNDDHTIDIYETNKVTTFEITLNGMVDSNDDLKVVVTDKVQDNYQTALSENDTNNITMGISKSTTKANTWIITITGHEGNKWLGDQYATVWIVNDKLGITPKRIWLMNTDVKEDM